MEIVSDGSREIKLNGQPYRVGVLNIGDLSDFAWYLKDKRKTSIIESAKQLYGDNIPDMVFDKLLQLDKTDMLEEIQTEDGMSALSLNEATFLLWKGLIKFNPAMLHSEVEKLITIDQAETALSAVLPKELKKKKRTKVKKKKKA